MTDSQLLILSSVVFASGWLDERECAIASWVLVGAAVTLRFVEWIGRAA